MFKYEEVIRFPYALLYAGKKHTCNICNHNLKKYITSKSGEKICPYCGSISRTRRLYQIIQNEHELKGKILHFSPSRSLYRRLKNNSNISYYSSDFENEFIADYNFDITSIPVADNYFDFIICYHILEHIIDDKKAIQELYRVLKPKKTILIQTPFKSGNIYENENIISPEERLKHFGQEDHVRIYSVEGLKKRLKENNFTTIQAKEYFMDTENNVNGLQLQEVVLEVIK
ncbi:class I SAM-dependent methyltransferase [uncultured Aquimarina sp.]|uniref:class I SAM-dependent methyltransferase n=1 Tax=uncultured Aquimarina sp. TaxID=575652 RepID=UPI002629CA11|nr:class I SAM-dependent methyltransferase [uncultured Aquimarina sp.]